jgi:hypothetical protein
MHDQRRMQKLAGMQRDQEGMRAKGRILHILDRLQRLAKLRRKDSSLHSKGRDVLKGCGLLALGVMQHYNQQMRPFT